MFGSIEIADAYLKEGTFEFSPEGYAERSEWKPVNALCFSRMFPRIFSSDEEAIAARDRFIADNVGKLHVVKKSYWGDSLRNLFPDRWVMAYDPCMSHRMEEGKKIPLYTELKRTLYLKSRVLGYGDSSIHKKSPDYTLARYIKEQSASSARLKAIALRAYESVANLPGFCDWTANGPTIFLCLAAAKSSLDSLAAIIGALLFCEVPPEKKIPSMATLNDRLKTKGGHPFRDDFSKLNECSWYTNLKNARDKVVHRSANPIIRDGFGVGFDFDLELFGDVKPDVLNVLETRSKDENDIEKVHLDQIMKGFVKGLEDWEDEVAQNLADLSCYQSLNKDGILMGIEFSDRNLMNDGRGPSKMVCSYAEGMHYKNLFVGLHSLTAESPMVNIVRT